MNYADLALATQDGRHPKTLGERLGVNYKVSAHHLGFYQVTSAAVSLDVPPGSLLYGRVAVLFCCTAA